METGAGRRRDPRLAAWLIRERRAIEGRMAARLGGAAPGPGEPEAEALRRFRSFAATALQQGRASAPSLDGLRPGAQRLAALLDAWTEAAVELSGANASDVRGALAPLVSHFRAALHQTAPARRKRGAARTGRRAVIAAIDRVADGFLAIDVDSRRIVDANPAAAALLETSRDSMLDAEAARFIPESARDAWWTELDAVAEGIDARRFSAVLGNTRGESVPVDVSLTRHASRARTLALLLLRPTSP